MELDDALESGREQAAEYPEGPWPAVLAELDRRGAAIERVRVVHQLAPYAPSFDPYCDTCAPDAGWPCPTNQALDGPTAA